MGTFRQFWKQPQRVWLRKALFQIHLWTGIATGLYVLLISVSGSAIVFRNDIYRATESPVILVEEVGERMTLEQIEDAARRPYPGYQVTQVYEFPDNPKRAVEVRLEKGSSLHNRLIDPYTGSDLGAAVPWPIRVMAWFEDLHVNLFGGRNGRQINAAGGVLWSLLALTGIVVWWQGIQNWKRGLGLRFKSGWKRFNWDLHSSVGFWTFLLTLMWGLTGVFAAIPDPFRAAVDYLEPLQRIENPSTTGAPRGRGIAQRSEGPGQLNTPGSTAQGEQAGQPGPGQRGQRGQRGGRGRRPQFKPRVGDQILRGAYALHFGNFAGNKLKIAWVILGLVPGVLFLTGILMWINRVIRRLPRMNS
jgi:uncharacterized iron-regulated membrane protein